MDIQLHYTKTGSGFPLILLHGNGEDSTYFEHQIPVFSRDFTVCAIDTRGHGRSPKGTTPFTLSQFADDLRDFMAEQGLEQADILGFSDGGNIALIFALRYPERVRRLVLNAANLFPEGMEPWLLEDLVREHRTLAHAETPEELHQKQLLELMHLIPNLQQILHLDHLQINHLMILENLLFLLHLRLFHLDLQHKDYMDYIFSKLLFQYVHRYGQFYIFQLFWMLDI